METLEDCYFLRLFWNLWDAESDVPQDTTFIHPLTVSVSKPDTGSPWDGLSPDIHTPAAQAYVTLAPRKMETLKEGEETTLSRFLRQVTKSEE